jgi:hypothetical protein
MGGRVVYFPWNIGRIFWEVMAEDHSRLIGNAVRWALGKTPEVTVEGDGVLDVSVRRAEEGVAVVLFNLTNPMMMKGPIRKSQPVGTQTVSVAVPEGVSSAQARLIVADRTVPVTVREGWAKLDVPEIDVLETVHLVWA